MPQNPTPRSALAWIFGLLVAIAIDAPLHAEDCAADVMQENIDLTPAVNGWGLDQQRES